MVSGSDPASSADDLPPDGKRTKLRLESDARALHSTTESAAVDRTRCRLFVGFPEGHLRDVSQAVGLFPTATSIQLPRSVDCVFESPAEAAAVAARLQTEVAAGRLGAAAVVHAERPTNAPGRRTVLRDMTRLHVRGIQRTVTVPELRQLFVGCDAVTVPGNNARGNNGYAFVQFPDRESAAAVMAQQLKLHDKELTVSYAVERNMQRAGDPKYELVEIDGDPGGDQPKQSLPTQSTDGSSTKPAATGKGRQRKHGKDGKPSKKDLYMNHSKVLSSK